MLQLALVVGLVRLPAIVPGAVVGLHTGRRSGPDRIGALCTFGTALPGDRGRADGRHRAQLADRLDAVDQAEQPEVGRKGGRRRHHHGDRDADRQRFAPIHRTLLVVAARPTPLQVP